MRGAGLLWASATTSVSERRQDLLRDKQRIVLSFFRHTEKLPSEVEPADVQGPQGRVILGRDGAALADERRAPPSMKCEVNVPAGLE